VLLLGLDLQHIRLTGSWWLVLICSERKIFTGCRDYRLVCSERKLLLTDKRNQQSACMHHPVTPTWCIEQSGTDFQFTSDEHADSRDQTIEHQYIVLAKIASIYFRENCIKHCRRFRYRVHEVCLLCMTFSSYTYNSWFC
jgi:hypothetical protein